MWGQALSESPQTPEGGPYPSAAPAGSEGPECARRCVGGGPLRVPELPQGVHIPPRLRQDRRDSGATAVVWKRLLACCPRPLGCPYPFVVRARPEGPGMTAVVWGMDPSVCPHNPHGASLSLPGPGRTGDSGVAAAVWGGGLIRVPPRPPRGFPTPPRPRPDRRGSGGTAAVRGGDLSACP